MGAVPQKNKVTFGKFQNIDMRVARIESAQMAEGTRHPCRIVKLDIGDLGHRQSIGQFALVDETDLVEKNVVVCVNLGEREMGPYISDALVLGAPHPDNPEGESQATPIFVSNDATPGDCIY